MENSEQKIGKGQVKLPLILAATLAVGMFIGQKLPLRPKRTAWQQRQSCRRHPRRNLRYVESKYCRHSKHHRSAARSHRPPAFQTRSALYPYITPDELQAVEDDMSGGFEGIGIEFIMLDDTMQVVTPFPAILLKRPVFWRAIKL